MFIPTPFAWVESDLHGDNMITIITVSFNAASTIEQTIRSVIDQTYPDIEYIVIDGGSTDGTAELVRSLDPSLAQWVSEPDDGIADAMNKGLALASGEYVLYLNADDYLLDAESIDRVADLLAGDLVTAPIIKREGDGSERLFQPRGFNWWFNFKTGLFHQGTFCAREVLNELGGFDTQLALSMDYDLFLRAYRRGYGVRLIDQPFSVMRSGGVSTRNDALTLRKRLAEEKAIHKRHCPTSIMRIVYALYWMTYPKYKGLRGRFDRHLVGY